MQVTSETKIHELVSTYPYMLDWLVATDPHFENLRNPALFQTMARFADLKHAAEMAGIELDPFLDSIRTEIARHEIVAEEAAGAAAPVGEAAEATAAERQEALKAIIRKLHDGVPAEQVKAEFDQLARGVDSAEIARMEQALIAEGMPIEDVQRLCDVHVTVFKESLDTKPDADVPVGHPLDAYKRENSVASEIVAELRAGIEALSAISDDTARAEIISAITSDLDRLGELDVHFKRKEHQLFPRLEDHDVSGPTKVMWGIDDDIRDRLRTARTIAAAADAVSLVAILDDTLKMVEDMVYKEEKILFPTALSVLSEREWSEMAAGDAEIGYAWAEGEAGRRVPEGSAAQRFALQPAGVGRPPAESPLTPPAPAAPPGAPHEAPPAAPSGELLLPLPTGSLTLAQLNVLFRAVPFDLTYVDENDRVRFYSEGERVFPRSPGAIGREVRNCHPPKSLAKVEQILAEFKAGTKDVAEFWIEFGEKFIHIRYFALRDDKMTYKGCLEVVHDATHVRSLTGQRRIVEWGGE